MEVARFGWVFLRTWQNTTIYHLRISPIFVLLLCSESNSLMGTNRSLVFKRQWKNLEKKKLIPSGLTISRENLQPGKKQNRARCASAFTVGLPGGNAVAPWAGKDVAGLCQSGFPHFRWKHRDVSKHDTTVPLCNSLNQQRRWPQGNSGCSDTGGWWPQLPPQDLLPDICQNQGFDVPRHRTPFCSWLGFAPQQTAKPACLAPHPDDPPMSPSNFPGYSSVHQRPSFALVLLFQLHMPGVFVHSNIISPLL